MVRMMPVGLALRGILPAVQAGLFLTLEGPDGAGKSSQAHRLHARLRAGGYAVTAVREPGGTPLAEAVRAHLMATSDHDPRSDALLFNAARASLVREVVSPALAHGDLVIGDRHADSTLAYQGYGSGLDLAELGRLNAFATDGLRPDLTILFDLPAAVGLARRAAGAASGHTRFEDPAQHDLAFHERVRLGYLAMAAAEPARWRVLDADRAAGAIAADVVAVVTAWLAERGFAPAAGPLAGEPAAAALRMRQ
jgi:dTMP kinase